MKLEDLKRVNACAECDYFRINYRQTYHEEVFVGKDGYYFILKIKEDWHLRQCDKDFKWNYEKNCFSGTLEEAIAECKRICSK